MASKIENLVKLSIKTFLCRRDLARQQQLSSSAEKHFQGLFNELVNLANTLKGDDIALNQLLKYPPHIRRHKPTALYSEIYDSPLLSVCIFVLYPNAKLPLHSHPGMYGVLKLLHGQIVIKSYSPTKPEDICNSSVPVLLARESTIQVTEDSPPAIVTPEMNNLHEVINANDDFAVFLDILSPRYENDSCYFVADHSNGSYNELKRIPCPPTFHTISVEFPLSDELNLPYESESD